MIVGKFLFDKPVKNDLRAYNIRKIVLCQGVDHITGYLLDYSYFKEHYKMTATDLSKQQALDAYPTQCNKLILLEI